MSASAQASTNGNRVRPWLAVALLLAATVAGATEPMGDVAEPAASAAEPGARTTAPGDSPAESVARAEPAIRATESVDGAGRPHTLNAKPSIGRIFFSPAERRSRHSGGALTATSAETGATQAAPSSSRDPAKERLVVNGALSSSTQGRAVWVNGRAVENSERNKSAWTDRNGNVWLVNGDHGIRLIRPGQSIDRSGVIEDLLPPGAVTRR
jgi:hypothetical protein